MDRRIVSFERDDAGEWIANLDCLHRRHVRHNPPFRVAAWVLDEAERASRIGTPLDCGLCDVAELPEGLEVVRTTATWDEASMPTALRRAHRVGAATWGRVVVVEGALRFVARTAADIPPLLEVVVPEGGSQPIPPELDHEVEPLGHVRFFVEFLRPQA